MSLVTFPRQFLVDINGTPRVGAKATFYQAGTSTLITVYTTPAYSAPHQNPVESVAGGLFPAVYVNQAVNATYKMVITDSASVPLYTEDNIPALGFTESDVSQLINPQTDVELVTEIAPSNYTYGPSAQLGYHVLRVGADSTGVTSSDTAIANAISVAKLMGVQLSGGSAGRDQGVDVYLPAGLYTIDEPIVLPRGGNPRAYCVGLIGDGEATRIQPSASFPTGRGIIEWEATTARVFNQRIRNLKLEMRDDLAHKAIFFELNDPTPSDWSQPWGAEEIKELRIENVQIHGSNEFHEVLVDIEGKAKYSRFEITADMVPGDTQTYSTIILRANSALTGTDGLAGDKADAIAGDNAGINYSYVNVFGLNSRGGRTTAFQGRIHNSFVERLGSATGAFGAASVVELYGSSLNVIAWLFCEGRQEDPQVYLEDCYSNQFLSCGVGTPDTPGPGTAFELVASEDNVFWNHPSAAGKPAYSSFGGFLIDMDADCKRNRFYNFASNGAAFAAEVQDLGTDNYIEFLRADTNLLTRSHWPVSQTIGPFTQEDLAASQTDAALDGTRWIAPRAGSVTAIMIKLTEARTAGNLTFKVFKNAAANLSGAAGAELDDDLQADFSSLNTQSFTATFTPGLYTFAAGDELFITVTSTSGWLPETSDVRAWLEVKC